MSPLHSIGYKHNFLLINSNSNFVVLFCLKILSSKMENPQSSQLCSLEIQIANLSRALDNNFIH